MAAYIYTFYKYDKIHTHTHAYKYTAILDIQS